MLGCQVGVGMSCRCLYDIQSRERAARSKPSEIDPTGTDDLDNVKTTVDSIARSGLSQTDWITQE